MDKLLEKSSEVALSEITEALAELRNCQDEIRKGLTAQAYVDIANKKLSRAISHMLNAQDWVDAINKSRGRES